LIMCVLGSVSYCLRRDLSVLFITNSSARTKSSRQQRQKTSSLKLCMFVSPMKVLVRMPYPVGTAHEAVAAPKNGWKYEACPECLALGIVLVIFMLSKKVLIEEVSLRKKHDYAYQSSYHADESLGGVTGTGSASCWQCRLWLCRSSTRSRFFLSLHTTSRT
jgi:hypothetical protein